jgi:hypothetical protein
MPAASMLIQKPCYALVISLIHLCCENWEAYDVIFAILIFLPGKLSGIVLDYRLDDQVFESW